MYSIRGYAGFPSFICHLLAMWPLGKTMAFSLSHSFLLCTMGKGIMANHFYPFQILCQVLLLMSSYVIFLKPDDGDDINSILQMRFREIMRLLQYHTVMTMEVYWSHLPSREPTARRVVGEHPPAAIPSNPHSSIHH